MLLILRYSVSSLFPFYGYFGFKLIPPFLIVPLKTSTHTSVPLFNVRAKMLFPYSSVYWKNLLETVSSKSFRLSIVSLIKCLFLKI